MRTTQCFIARLIDFAFLSRHVMGVLDPERRKKGNEFKYQAHKPTLGSFVSFPVSYKSSVPVTPTRCPWAVGFGYAHFSVGQQLIVLQAWFCLSVSVYCIKIVYRILLCCGVCFVRGSFCC